MTSTTCEFFALHTDCRINGDALQIQRLQASPFTPGAEERIKAARYAGCKTAMGKRFPRYMMSFGDHRRPIEVIERFSRLPRASPFTFSKVVIRSIRVDHNLRHPVQPSLPSLPSRQYKIALAEAVILLEAVERYGNTLFR